jgi:hypothetical protein
MLTTELRPAKMQRDLRYARQSGDMFFILLAAA